MMRKARVEQDAADLAVPSLMPRHLDDEISHQWTTGSVDNCLGFVIPGVLSAQPDVLTCWGVAAATSAS